MKGLAILLLAAVTPPAARETVGVYRGWAAFRDPDRCYAIAAPVKAGRARRRQPFASVGTWPGRGLRSSLHVRLSRAHDRSAAVTLSVGERRFTLVAGRVDAWARDAASDRAIVAAMRAARSMSVETVAVGGRSFADTYALAGAATAIDAALLACVGR
ncbi:hypothetical protein [Sphingomonas rubra]|uniref:Uncharacterized protein n=1 Tax=Sphingomonas rubra TaxID=634430 RepID=A0A1I5T6H1_9SPHN|nr:hypothetical protein [Sphingomonas rubra]SFP78247.1 hypothetical protein SAMN04488241_10759 [Sphingomonas rubra]